MYEIKIISLSYFGNIYSNFLNLCKKLSEKSGRKSDFGHL